MALGRSYPVASRARFFLEERALGGKKVLLGGVTPFSPSPWGARASCRSLQLLGKAAASWRPLSAGEPEREGEARPGSGGPEASSGRL